MRAVRPSTRRAVAVLLAATAALSATPAMAAADGSGEARAATGAVLAVNGHGWGHGRGLGQYGAYGYASLAGWSGGQILDHFYSNTTAGDVGDPVITVRLNEKDAQATVVTLDRGHPSILDVGEAPDHALKVERAVDGSWQVSDGPGCGGPWTPRPATIAAPLLRIVPAVADPGQTDPQDALQLCGSGTDARWVRGNVLATQSDGVQYTVNELTMNSYLRGVVPRESPASWPAASLQAQAVAARSYAYAEDRYPYAKTCSTTSCQVYGGWQIRVNDQTTRLEVDSTNQAVADTSGVVRKLGSSVARTEFSSSTGGWTAGGTFPSVVDDGDGVSSNPNHSWSSGIPVDAIESAYGLGTFQGAQVTARTSADGGRRVATIHLVFSNGSKDVSGSEFQAKFGLKSTWFDVKATPAARSIDDACPPGQVPPDRFSDVPQGSSHQPAIDCVAWWQIAQGTSDGRYLPSAGVTRAQMATFIANEITKAGGTLPADAPDAFDDDNGNVHEAAINQLAAAGLVTGRAPRQFAPNEPVGRGQMAKFVAGAWRQRVGSDLAAGQDWFTDDNGTTFESDINRIAEAGIATGLPNGTYGAGQVVTRGQMAEFLARLLAKEVAEGHAQLPQ